MLRHLHEYEITQLYFILYSRYLNIRLLLLVLVLMGTENCDTVNILGYLRYNSN
jgi:hypothetical protein